MKSGKWKLGKPGMRPTGSTFRYSEDDYAGVIVVAIEIRRLGESFVGGVSNVDPSRLIRGALAPYLRSNRRFVAGAAGLHA